MSTKNGGTGQTLQFHSGEWLYVAPSIPAERGNILYPIRHLIWGIISNIERNTAALTRTLFPAIHAGESQALYAMKRRLPYSTLSLKPD